MNPAPLFDGSLNIIVVSNLTQDAVLPKVVDDDFYCMQFSCETLGGSLFEYKNMTSLLDGNKTKTDDLKAMKKPKYPELLIYDENT